MTENDDDDDEIENIWIFVKGVIHTHAFRDWFKSQNSTSPENDLIME